MAFPLYAFIGLAAIYRVVQRQTCRTELTMVNAIKKFCLIQRHQACYPVKQNVICINYL